MGPLGSRTEQDIRLMYVNTSKPFVACFAPKTGCTLWKSLVKYVNTGVCRLQARDFTNFGYPCWDGIKDTFRIL